MWDGVIDARHLYTAVRLTAHTHGRDGAPSKTVVSGTGFIVRSGLFTGDRKGFLVTNRHVLDPDFVKSRLRTVYKVEVAGFVQNSGAWKGVSYLSGNAKPVRFTIESPEPMFADGDHDIALIDLETAKVPGGCPDLTELSNLNLACNLDFEQRVHVGAQVITPGYPSIDHVTAHRPILVSGTVASNPRESAETGAHQWMDHVLCHSFGWGGMSGSPVFGSN
ncbi:serine protease [Kitasatospora sp. NPDC059973]|uniref:S1 family peptidase n=1 Tax=Kitasatospora sp. NPDC059973 TaxID=3347020 RepID=UPI0036C8D6BD